MADAVVLFVVVAGARLAYSLVSLARECIRAQALAILLRAAGPGGVVEAAHGDGSVVIVRAAAVTPSRATDR